MFCRDISAVDEKYISAYEKLKALIIRIQDITPDVQVNGCWRGMFDMNRNSWGGGDRYEGGAGSIYTGWTNAPISWVLALDILKRNLFS